MRVGLDADELRGLAARILADDDREYVLISWASSDVEAKRGSDSALDVSVVRNADQEINVADILANIVVRMLTDERVGERMLTTSRLMRDLAQIQLSTLIDVRAKSFEAQG